MKSAFAFLLWLGCAPAEHGPAGGGSAARNLEPSIDAEYSYVTPLSGVVSATFGDSPIVADFNGDGEPELVSATQVRRFSNNWLTSTYQVVSFAGTSAGPLATPTVLINYGGNETYDAGFAVGDLNGDGYNDLVHSVGTYSDVSCANCDNAFLLLGGTQGFTNAWGAYHIDGPAAVSDVDGDGFDDLVATRVNPPVVQIHRGSPNGVDHAASFTVPVPNGGIFNLVASVGDVNGDGFGDLAAREGTTDYREGTIHLLVGSALGPVATNISWTVPTNGSNGFGFVIKGVGDVNGDGFDDLAIDMSDPSLAMNEGKLSIYLGNANGADLNPVTEIHETYRHNNPWYSWSDEVVSGDVNDDGYSDVIARKSGRRISIHLGGPLGTDPEAATTWQPSSRHPDPRLDGMGRSLAFAGDLDHDGSPDLIVTTSATTATNQIGSLFKLSLVEDRDGDGYTNLEDCDDSDAAISPDAEEIDRNAVDEDCDGVAAFGEEDTEVALEGDTDVLSTEAVPQAESVEPSREERDPRPHTSAAPRGGRASGRR